MGFDKKQAYSALKKYSSLEVFAIELPSSSFLRPFNSFFISCFHFQGAVEALMNNENFEVESDEDENLIYQSDEEINWNNVGVEYNDDQEESYSSVQNFEFHNKKISEQTIEADSYENYLDNDAIRMSKKQAAMELVTMPSLLLPQFYLLINLFSFSIH